MGDDVRWPALQGSSLETVCIWSHLLRQQPADISALQASPARVHKIVHKTPLLLARPRGDEPPQVLHIACIAALCAIEGEINGQTAQHWRRLSATSTLGRAIPYEPNRWEALARYLEDGRLSIDENLTERQQL